jgi:hypothetical protein
LTTTEAAAYRCEARCFSVTVAAGGSDLSDEAGMMSEFDWRAKVTFLNG